MYAIVDSSAFEDRRKPIARELGAQAIRLNRFDSQPENETRQVVAGPRGLSYVVVGAVVE